MEIMLREWTRDDADALVNIVCHSDMRYMRRVGDGEYTTKDAMDYISWVLGTGKHKKAGPAHGVFRAIVMDDVPVGTISVEVGRDVAAIDGQIGYYLMREYTGKGIATYAIERIVELAFERLDIQRISAYVAAENAASIRVLAKNGFEREGTLRRGAYMNDKIIDVDIMARLR